MIRASAYTFILVITLFLLGCEGAAGPDGADTPEMDLVAPPLELVQPPVGAVLTGQTMSLEAVSVDTAGVESEDIESIRFYVNGLSVVNGDTAIVRSAPYSFVWDFESANTGYGEVVVAASVTDTLGNIRFAPARVVTRFELAGMDTLTDRYGPGVMDDVLVPQLLIEEDDTVRVTHLGTRFDPYGACTVNTIRLFPVWRPAGDNYSEIPDFWLSLYASADGLTPGEPLDSFRVEMDPLELDRWQEYDLNGLMSESVRSIADGESFFVVVRPEVAEPDSMDAGLRIGALLEADSTETPDMETAWWYERPPEGNGWTPVAARHAQGLVHHLFVDVVIEYVAEGEE